MVASAVFFLDMKGKIIIWRNYRGDVPKAAVEKFSRKVQEEDEADLKPVYTEDGITYMYIKHNNLFLLAVTKKNANVALVLTFFEKLVTVLTEYFGDLTEDSLRDNFVITYELLDEVMDYGYPQLVESKVLREFIMNRGVKAERQLVPPPAATNAVSWRHEGIKHKKNEVFLDVVEKLNLLVSSTGEVLSSEIEGSVDMRSMLSGMPVLKLGLNDKLMFRAAGKRFTKGKAVELEDIKFHQCVRLAQFEADRVINFIPPDGEFVLMSYRLNTHVKPLIWVETTVEKYSSRIEFMIRAKSQFKSRSIANNVEILIPVPSDVDTPSFKAAIGSVSYLPDQNAMRWKMKQLHGHREYLMRAHFGLPSVKKEESKEDDWKKPIRVTFEVPYFTVSGIQVRYLRIMDKSGYQALPWVRYITKNGDYQIRMP